MLQLIRVLDSGEGGDLTLELGLEVWVVEDAERTSVDVIDDSLLKVQQEGLAVVDQDLRDVLIHDDGTLNRVLGKLLQLDVLVDLSLDCLGSSGHLVGLDLPEGVLSTQIATDVDQIVELLLQVSDGLVLEVICRHLCGQLKGGINIAVPQLLSDHAADGLLLALDLRVLLDEASLHVHQLVLHLLVGVPSHVCGDDQLLDLGVLGDEILQANLCKLVEDLEVLQRVLNDCLERCVSGLAVDPAVSVASERAGDRKVGLLPPSDGIADSLLDGEALLLGCLEVLVALLHIIIHDLSVSDEDDVGELLLDDLAGDQMGLVSSVSTHLSDGLLELLLGRRSSTMVPEVVVTYLASVLFQDLAHYFPVVDKVSH